MWSSLSGVAHRALPHVPAEDIVVAPDCGLKYLPRNAAYGSASEIKAAFLGLQALPRSCLVRAEGLANCVDWLEELTFWATPLRIRRPLPLASC